jgi:SHS2 domain-containing protein
MINDSNYFDHDADMGIIGRGKSLESCFEETALALFALTGNLSQVKPTQQIVFKFAESDIEFALVTWLNLLIAHAQTKHLLFSSFKIRKRRNVWYCEARGEIWHPGIERGIDVKGATLTMLSVKKIGEQWQAQCVVDV